MGPMRRSSIVFFFCLTILSATYSLSGYANELIVDTIHPGETAQIRSRGITYDLNLIMVSSGPHISPRALFSLNGER